jgi:DNA-directed RNA polymerase subunit alpha
MDQRFFESNQTNQRSVTFPIDAIFMPIKQVNFSIQEHSIDGEYLYFEIWTNGSIHPFDAMKSAAKVCMKLMASCLTRLTDERIYADELKLPETPNFVEVNYKKIESDTDLNEVLIEQLELSLRAYNCLKRSNVHTLKDLLQYSQEDLLELKNFGQKSASEVCASLESRFGQTLPKRKL